MSVNISKVRFIVFSSTTWPRQQIHSEIYKYLCIYKLHIPLPRLKNAGMEAAVYGPRLIICNRKLVDEMSNFS